MLENTTILHPSVLTLNFGELTEKKYLYSVLVLLCFLLVLLFNSTVILTIVLHRRLHEAMYIFIAVLCLNSVYGAIAFFPSLFVNLVSKTQAISYTACIIQVFALHTYGGYNTIMTLTTVYKLIVLAWLFAILPITPYVILTARLSLCGSVIQKIYCDNLSLLKLSCIDTSFFNIYGVILSAAMAGGIPALILVSYIQILRVCLRSSKDFRAKAVQTCTPHLVMISFIMIDVSVESLFSRLPTDLLPYELRTTILVLGYSTSAVLNPLIYGLKIREIRV
ncbi:hypothetical protein GDO86_020130 [Hymenochirus boettgeri]|uniref:G-protein coupled receptors family 1 profile domain-containing protein n=1 Tax=Hymenochirus boettgeri TaxID=247094 RepID=A0A8T2IHZ0_9PIPI|nr:hypothetical protein GDO86_020130 [Hymenochirus boettgeri]